MVVNIPDLVLDTYMSIENDRRNLDRNIMDLRQSASKSRTRAEKKLAWGFFATTIGIANLGNMLVNSDTPHRVISGVIGAVALCGGLYEGREALREMERYSSINEMVAVDKYKMDQLRHQLPEMDS